MSAPLQSVLHPAGADAAVISQFAWVLFGIGALIFVAVMVLVLLSVRRQERPVRPALWIAGAGVAFPVVVLFCLFSTTLLRARSCS